MKPVASKLEKLADEVGTLRGQNVGVALIAEDEWYEQLPDCATWTEPQRKECEARYRALQDIVAVAGGPHVRVVHAHQVDVHAGRE